MSSTSLTTGRAWRPGVPRRHVPVLATLALLCVAIGLMPMIPVRFVYQALNGDGWQITQANDVTNNVNGCK